MIDRNQWREAFQRDGSVLVDVKVVLGSAKSEIVGLMAEGSLKVKLAAIPAKGKANQELCLLLAEAFGVARSKVRLISGETSQWKRVQISR